MRLTRTSVADRAGAIIVAALLLAGEANAQSQGGNGVSNFFGNIFSGQKSDAPAQPPAAPGPDGAPPPWSGEDGASGHPLMTASAIRQAAANFDRCIANYWPEAAKRGITRENFEFFTGGLTPDLRIMDLLDAQPEFTKSVWDYLDLLVTDARMQRGKEILAQYKPIFDAVEKAYGVDRTIIASIWGVESNYSTMAGDRSVVRSTATLACV